MKYKYFKMTSSDDPERIIAKNYDTNAEISFPKNIVEKKALAKISVGDLVKCDFYEGTAFYKKNDATTYWRKLYQRKSEN